MKYKIREYYQTIPHFSLNKVKVDILFHKSLKGGLLLGYVLDKGHSGWFVMLRIYIPTTFRTHDADGDNKLDGLELLQAIRHAVDDQIEHAKESGATETKTPMFRTSVYAHLEGTRPVTGGCGLEYNSSQEEQLWFGG